MTIAIDLSQMITAETRASEALAEIRARIRARRDQAIAGGITPGGIPVQTDDLSQTRIMGAAVGAMLDPTYTVQWKTTGGWVTFDAPQVIAIATAVRSHVQACFDHEAQLLAALAAGAPYDSDACWPGS